MSSVTLKTILFIRKIIYSSAWSKRFAVYSVIPPNPGISENFFKNSFLALWSSSFTRAKAGSSQSVHEPLQGYHPLWVRKGLLMVNKELGKLPDVWAGCSPLSGTNSAFLQAGIERGKWQKLIIGVRMRRNVGLCTHPIQATSTLGVV